MRRSQSSRSAMVRPQTGTVFVAACTLLLSAGASAFELPAVGGIDPVGRDEKLTRLEFGAFYGDDSNVSRAPDGSEQSGAFTRTVAGLVFARGNERRKIDLQIHAKMDKYSELSEFDADETRALLGLQVDANTVLASLRAEYAMLTDPTDIALTDLMERTQMSVLPSFDLRLGGMLELSAGYSIKSSDYEATFDYLDYDENSIVAELRMGRREGGRQVFVHFDKGKFEYGPGIRDDDDFEFDRLYGGFRTEVSRSSHELAVGTSNVDVTTLPGSEIYAAYRSTFKLNERSTFLLGVAHGPEAAVGAEYKTATRVIASYRRQVNSRWRWSLSVGNESAELVTPEAGYPDDLTRLTADAGMAADIGSPGRLHGRLYLTVGYENRTSSDASFDYSRLRSTAGLSFVY